MVINLRKAGIFWLYCLCLFVLVRPAYLTMLDFFKSMYSLAMLLVMVGTAVIFLYKYQKAAINKTMLLICLFLGLPVLISMVKGVSLSPGYYVTPLSWIVLVMLLYMGFEHHYEQMLRALSFVLSLYVYINFITMLLFPNTLYSTEVYRYSNWFLGYKNVMVRTMLPALAATAVYDVYRKDHFTLRTGLLYACSIVSVVFGDSKTGIVGLVIFGILLYLFREGEMPQFVNLKNIGILLLLISVALTAFDLLSLFTGYISSLGEEGSIANRIIIWDQSIWLILKHPIFGYGYRSTADMRDLLDVSLGWTYVSHAHNYFLHILMQGGIVLFVIGAWIYWRIGRRCLRFRGDFTSKTMLAMYVAFLSMGLVESLVGATLLYPLMMLAETTGYHSVVYRKRRNVPGIRIKF